jgi:hypothetical protein
VGTDPEGLKVVLGTVLEGEEYGGFDVKRVNFEGLEEGWNSKVW